MGPGWSHRGLALAVGERHPDDVEREVNSYEEEGEVGDGDAELEGSSVLEVEQGGDSTARAAGGEAGEIETRRDRQHDEPAQHTESEGIFLNKNNDLFSVWFVCLLSDLCDVLLVNEGEHDGYVAVQDPDELRQKVEIEGKVDHGEDEGALDG